MRYLTLIMLAACATLRQPVDVPLEGSGGDAHVNVFRDMAAKSVLRGGISLTAPYGSGSSVTFGSGTFTQLTVGAATSANVVTVTGLISVYSNASTEAIQIDGPNSQIWVKGGGGVYLNAGGSHRIFDAGDANGIQSNTTFTVSGGVIASSVTAKAAAGSGGLIVTDTTNTKNFTILESNDVATMYNNATQGILNLDGAAGVGVVAGTPAASSTFAKAIGTLNCNVTPVSSSGNASNLISYTMPANVLTTSTRGVRITAWGHVTNNANAKTVSLAWGGQTLVSKALTASVATLWRISAMCYRTGSSTQQCFAEAYNHGGTTVSSTDGATTLYLAAQTNGTQTETATIVIKGVATTATTTDITQDGQCVEYM